jgi:hypothetical protein
MMTNQNAELVLAAIYGNATRELTDLVMAAESAFDNYGKKSLLGRDKGKEGRRAVGRIRRAILTSFG